MVYYQRPQSPHRDEDPYYNNINNNNNNNNNNNTYRGAPVDVRDNNRDRDRDRDRDWEYNRARRSSYSPARGRSPPQDAPKGPRAYHGPSSSYRSRSDSHDRMSGGGNSGNGGSGGGGYYDRDAPRDRSRSRDDREWFGGPASRDVIIEGLGVDVDEDYVVNPPPWNDHYSPSLLLLAI